MDHDDIDDLLNHLELQTLDTDNSDLSSEVFSQSTQATTGDNDEPKSQFIDGKEYIESMNLARPIRKGRGKSSSVWRLGIELKRVDDGAKFWQCLICKRMNKSTLYTAAATSGPFKHLKNDHNIVEENKRFVWLEKQKRLVSEESEDSHSTVIRGLNCRASVDFLFSKTLMDEFRLLFLQWIICCHLALSMVENRFFRALIRFINRTVLDYLPESSATVRKWVISEYQRQKEIRKEAIRQSRSRISISFDTWTAPFARKHIISIIAHFVDENWERRFLQLSMSRLYGGHSGANLSAHIVPILRDWGINDRIGYFITDNEAANGTAIDHILGTIEPTYKKADRPKRWVRCLPHTLNLAAQAFMLGRDPELFEANIQGAELTNNMTELQSLWRACGFIGKLINIIRSIRRSPKQRTEFERIKVNECGDIEWLAAEDIEDEQQLEVRSQRVSFILSANDSSSLLQITRPAGTRLLQCFNVLNSVKHDYKPTAVIGVRRVMTIVVMIYEKISCRRRNGKA